MAQTKPNEKHFLGRLAALGVRTLRDVAFYLPVGWDDFTRTLKDFADPQAAGRPWLVRATLARPPEARIEPGRPPRLVGKVRNSLGQELTFVVFGDTRELQKRLAGYVGREIALFGNVTVLGERLLLSNPELAPDSQWFGKLRPRYPARARVMGPDTVRARILALLPEAAPEAADWICRALASLGGPADIARFAAGPGWTIERLIQCAHLPTNVEQGLAAQQGLERLAAAWMWLRAQASRPRKPRPRPLALGRMGPRAQRLGFSLTDEQRQAAAEIWRDLRSPLPMRRILSGETGTGKTAVFALVAAAVVDAGGLVIALFPNDTLARQTFEAIRSWWPDLPCQLVTADTTEPPVEPFLVGTTAILHRVEVPPDLLIIDEQQKFSREQREALLGEHTHLLEVTATCIPRTQALLRYGVLDVSRLTRPHQPKTIHTRIWEADEHEALFAAVQQTIREGGQVIVVYPRREEAAPEARDDAHAPCAPLPSVEEAAKAWEEWFPGRVRMIHATLPPEEKEAALKAMRERRADVIVCTTILEIGVNLPDARRIVVVHPERYGLSTLHQLRGRVARHGGTGWFDLFLPRPVGQATRERLEVLVRTADGFAIAEADLKLRGMGDIGHDGTAQAGPDETFLLTRPVAVETLDRVIQELGETPLPQARSQRVRNAPANPPPVRGRKPPPPQEAAPSKPTPRPSGSAQKVS